MTHIQKEVETNKWPFQDLIFKDIYNSFLGFDSEFTDLYFQLYTYQKYGRQE